MSQAAVNTKLTKNAGKKRDLLMWILHFPCQEECVEACSYSREDLNKAVAPRALQRDEY